MHSAESCVEVRIEDVSKCGCTASRSFERSEWDKVCKVAVKVRSFLQPGYRTADVTATFTSHATDKMSTMRGHEMFSTALCSILDQSDVHRRIRRTCFKNHEKLLADTFHSEVPLLVRWRWSSIQLCLSALRKVNRCLIAHWSLQKFLAGSAEDADIGNRRGQGRSFKLVSQRVEAAFRLMEV